MGWNRKQYERSGGKFRPVYRGEKDWTRAEKEQIRQFEERNGNDRRETDSDDGAERRKAG